MSLLRLLTAGKSLVGLKDSGQRYNVARRGLLPKFASKKNPFRAGSGPSAGPLAGTELISAPNQAEPNQLSSANGVRSVLPAITAPIEIIPPQMVPSSCLEVKKPVAEDIRTKSPTGWRALLPWMRARTPKPVIPRFEKTMIQGELSLESVKVVRNDLSDSDLEVVQTKPVAPAPQSKPARQPIPESGANDGSWERLTGRFLGAGKT